MRLHVLQRCCGCRLWPAVHTAGAVGVLAALPWRLMVVPAVDLLVAVLGVDPSLFLRRGPHTAMVVVAVAVGPMTTPAPMCSVELVDGRGQVPMPTQMCAAVVVSVGPTLWGRMATPAAGAVGAVESVRQLPMTTPAPMCSVVLVHARSQMPTPMGPAGAVKAVEAVCQMPMPMRLAMPAAVAVLHSVRGGIGPAVPVMHMSRGIVETSTCTWCTAVPMHRNL